MTDRATNEVGQLRLVDGARQVPPANLGVAERRTLLPLNISGRGKGRLHVLVELTGGAFGRPEMAQDLITNIVDEYYGTPGTITYGLRQAVLLANAYLKRSNERVTSEHRLGGVACVVLRGREAFVAQAGWPMVYLLRDQELIQAYPDTTLENLDESVLGQDAVIEVRLFRLPIQSGDTILMLDGPMARHLDPQRLGALVVGSNERALHNIETLAPDADCTAMIVRATSAPARTEGSAEQWTFTPVEPAGSDETTEHAEPLERPEAIERPEAVWQPEPEAAPATRQASTTPFQTGPASAAYREQAQPVQEPPVADRPRRAPPIRERPDTAPKQAGFDLDEKAKATLRTVGAGLRSLGERLLPDRDTPAGRAAAADSPAEQHVAQVQRRRRERARSSRRRDQPQQTNWGLAVALAIPILALLFVGGYMLFQNWSTNSQYNEHIEQAKRKREIALSQAESPTTARDYWLEVLSSLQAAEAVQPDQPEIAQMRDQAERELDRIDGVTRLSQIYKIFEYTEPSSAPGRVVVAGLDVYVLDRGSGRVYRHALNEPRNALRNPTGDQLLLQQGQVIEGKTVADLVDLTWMDDGGERQAGALLILDRAGQLFEYDPAWEQVGHQTLGGADTWRSPTSLRTFDSNLYLLDAMGNQVLKYPQGQYANSPDRWIAQADTDLRTAIDIGIDGNIYILHNNGKLDKYYGGERVPSSITRVPRPLSGGNALHLEVEEATQYIYIADASERRIVQLDRDGVFVRQLQPGLGQEDLFRGLAGLYVDEMGAKLYYVAANTLYITNLPPVQP
jgi:hypothetical protein